MPGPIKNLQPIGSGGTGPITNLQPLGGGDDVRQMLWEPSATASGDTTPYDAPQRPAPYGGFSPSNLAENFYEGARGTLEGAWNIGKDLASNPNWFSGKDSTAQKFVYGPAEQEWSKAKERAGEGRYSEAMGHGLAAAVPLVGPWAAERGEQIGQQDVGGALANMSGTSAGARALAAPVNAGAGILKGAYQEWPTFRDAMARAKTTGDMTEVRQLATHLIVGNTFAAVAGKPTGAGPMWYEQLRQDGRDVSRIEATAKSLTGIQQSALGLYNSIANTLQQHALALTRDAMRYMKPVVDADKAAGGAPVDTAGVRARVEMTKASNGYHPSAPEQSLIDKIGGQQIDPVVDSTAQRYYGKPYAQLDPIDQQNLRKILPPDLQPSPSKTMTLEQLLQLRTDIGQAAFRNKDATGRATMMSAYDSIGDLIKDRTSQIAGSSKPFEDYNQQLKTKFDLEQKGVTADMMQNLRQRGTVKADPAVVKLLDDFSKSAGDIDQVKAGMQKIGDKQGPRALDQAMKDAKSITAAHDTVQGKNLTGITRLFLKHPTSGGAWLGIGAALGLRGLLPFPFSFLLPAALGSSELALAERTKAGRVGLRLRAQLPPEYFEGRPEPVQPGPTPGVQHGPYPPEGGLPPAAAPAKGTPPAPKPAPAAKAPETPRMGAATEKASDVAKAQELRQQMQRGRGGSEKDWAKRNLTSGPTPESRAASEDAFRKNYPTEGMKEPSPLEKELWQEGVFGQKPAGDIGSKVRSVADAQRARSGNRAEGRGRGSERGRP